MRARKITGTAGTTQLITGAGQLRGFSIRESASSAAAATVKVYDAIAGNAIADLLETVDLAANASRTIVFGQDKPIVYKVGVRVVITGQIDGSLFTD